MEIRSGMEVDDNNGYETDLVIWKCYSIVDVDVEVLMLNKLKVESCAIRRRRIVWDKWDRFEAQMGARFDVAPCGRQTHHRTFILVNTSYLLYTHLVLLSSLP